MTLVLFGLALAWTICLILYRIFSNCSLRNVPGPFLGRLTRLWYLNRVRKGHWEKENIKLHRKYGSVVRVAPNYYSITGAEAVRVIYGRGGKFPKSAWYEAWKHPDPSRWTLFQDQNMKRHAETRKRFSSLYSMSSLVHYEEFVDQCAEIFTQRLLEYSEEQKSLDLGHWFQCYAFDVIGNITFGERFGFLDSGHDIEGAIEALQKLMAYSTLIGIYHEWHPRVYHLLSRFSGTGAGGRAYIMRFVEEKIKLHESQSKDSLARDGGAMRTQTFLEKMILARDKDPEKVTDYHIFMMGLANVVAGSDTTAITLSSIMYHLLRHPSILQKLRHEVDTCMQGHLRNAHITFKQSQEMPYLQAVIKEAMRLHSATGVPLWREVPEGGAEINGYHFPAGTNVGINTWVAHYDEYIFPNATEFRPERWIEAETNQEQLKIMNEMFMPVSSSLTFKIQAESKQKDQFGLGSRTCLGKHISFLEMSKLVPLLIREFTFLLVVSGMETETHFFVKPTNFKVRVQKRAM
ncbi:hypothetical protein AARAC_000002 [Aspergillus arachidicola]|uniref:Cytochrome P450 n=1 Tax=Aspergillus arachidicola TaxID=656916 RepID=A0A2G7FNS9_9EURO|nr:hypothetical protein AARAC_000002 [Aspergillus arachidicola]